MQGPRPYIGNGRIGGMVFGGMAEERIQLNEDSLWYGGPRSRLNPDARTNPRNVQELLLQGRVRDAERLSMTALAGVPENPAHYVPVGELCVDLDEHDGTPAAYRRELDLRDAVCRVAYELGGVAFAREVIASAADQVLALHLSSSRPGALSCTARFARERYAGPLKVVGTAIAVVIGPPWARRGFDGRTWHRGEDDGRGQGCSGGRVLMGT